MNLTSMNLIETLSEAVLVKKTPILGICLGMQLMTQCSVDNFLDHIKKVEDFEAGVIIFNFIDIDGMISGYDLVLFKSEIMNLFNNETSMISF